MALETIDGKWKQLSEAVKDRLGDFSEDDFKKLQNIFEQFLTFVNEKYTATREKASNEFSEMQSRFEDFSENLPESADSAKTQVVTTVKEKPWSVVIPAIIATTVLGLWMKKFAKA